jgi:photosystem II stability/assembly factor-like uncharacterized protein
MVFDPQNPSIIYGRWGGGNTDDGVYKSVDGGDTWKPTAISGRATGCCGLAIDPADPLRLYVPTHQGLMRSEDGGDTWTAFGGQVNQVLVDSTSTLYSVAGNTILVLRPGSSTVQKVVPASVNGLVLDPISSSTWYAITFSPQGGGNIIYKSTDSGDTWQRVSNGLPNSVSIGPLSLAIDPSAPETLYVGTFAQPDGFFAKLSADGSSLLYSTYLGGKGNDVVTAIAADATGNIGIAGTTDSADFPLRAPFRAAGTGVDGFAAKFDSANALVWSSPLGGGTPRAIALGPSSEVYLTGAASSAAFPAANSIQPFISSNFFWSADRGTTWTPSPVPVSSLPGPAFSSLNVVADPKTPARVYALSDRLYVSDDSGQSWTPLGAPAGPSGPNFFPQFWGPPLAIDPLTPTTMYAAGLCIPATNGPPICGVAKSTDSGASWNLNSITVSGSFPPQPIFVSGLTIDPKTPSTLYASAFNAGILKSTDAGETWATAFPLMNAAAVAVDPLNPTVVYSSIGANTGSIFRSSDGGATWATVTNGLPSGWFATALVTDSSATGRVYALGSFNSGGGLYLTGNSGNNWVKIGSGLPDGAVSTLAVDPNAPSNVYAAPTSGGLYRSTDAGASFTLMPGLRIPIVNRIAIDAGNGSQIYTGAQFNPSDAFVMKILE